MPTPLRLLFDDSLEQLRAHASPNLSAFQGVIAPILQAAGAGRLQPAPHEVINAIEVEGEVATLFTRLQNPPRGQPMDARTSYALPLFLLDEPDPVEAATIWATTNYAQELSQRLEGLRRDAASVERMLEHTRATLAELQKARDKRLAHEQGGHVIVL